MASAPLHPVLIDGHHSLVGRAVVVSRQRFAGLKDCQCRWFGKGVFIALSSFSPLDGSCAGTDQG